MENTKRLFHIINKSFQNFQSHILEVQKIVNADFEAYTGIEVAKAQVLLPAGLATNSKKAVKRWPDPIRQNANKATSVGGRRPAKPATH